MTFPEFPLSVLLMDLRILQQGFLVCIQGLPKTFSLCLFSRADQGPPLGLTVTQAHL